MTDDDKAFMIDLLRTAARLIEDGTITEWSIDQVFGHQVVNKPNGTRRRVNTGQNTITVTLEAGHLSSDRIPGWLSSVRPQLSD